jgi:HSP20 family protein
MFVFPFSNLVSNTSAMELNKSFFRFDNRDDSYIYAIDTPGVAREDLELEVRDKNLLIRTKETSGRQYRFSLVLPRHSNVEAVEASLELGVLEIKIPKRAEPRRLITVS